MTSNIDESLQITASDLVATKLVTTAFDGTNFGGWKRGMMIALSTKNKLGFINGTTPKPAPNSSTSRIWQRCDDLVLSWILNSVSESIANSILYSSSAKEAWDELEERFGKTNGAQLYAIHQKLAGVSQGNDSVSGYFTKIKQIWDEIDSLGMNPKCSCTCSCGATEKQKTADQNKKVVQFLMGLNDSYNGTRGTILMQKPLPSVGIVYNDLLQEEDQRNVRKSSEFQMNSASFYANNSKNQFNSYRGPAFQKNQSNFQGQSSFSHHNSQQNSQFRSNTLQCNYCKLFGHTIDRCRKLQYNNNKRKFANNSQLMQTSDKGLLEVFGSDEGETSRGMDEQDLCRQFMAFLKGKQQQGHSTSAAQFTTSAANFAGLFHGDSSTSW